MTRPSLKRGYLCARRASEMHHASGDSGVDCHKRGGHRRRRCDPTPTRRVFSPRVVIDGPRMRGVSSTRRGPGQETDMDLGPGRLTWPQILCGRGLGAPLGHCKTERLRLCGERGSIGLAPVGCHCQGWWLARRRAMPTVRTGRDKDVRVEDYISHHHHPSPTPFTIPTIPLLYHHHSPSFPTTAPQCLRPCMHPPPSSPCSLTVTNLDFSGDIGLIGLAVMVSPSPSHSISNFPHQPT